MEPQNSAVARLSEQLDILLNSYRSLKEEVEALRVANMELRAQNEGQQAHIAKLEEDLGMKEMETEDIIEKIRQAIQ